MDDLDLFSMNCSKKVNEIVSWLSGVIYGKFSNDELHAWVFGSLVNNYSNSNDCDVLILVDEKCISNLVQISPIWRQEFEHKFDFPLHLTRLTFSEAKSADFFTEAIFNKPVIQLHS